MDRFSKYLHISEALRGATCELELLTRLALPDGTTSEVAHTRRAVCKQAKRRGNVTVLEFADVDRAALDRVFPFETFTVADWPGLFAEHVGWRVPQGIGTVVKVPLAYVSNAGGAYVYAGPKVIGSAGTVSAVYRGTVQGQGAVVDASEYTVGTATGAVSGVQVRTITFTREQVDFQGRPHIIEADLVLPGSRYAADEIARILALYGLTTDATSFGAATTYDTAQSMVIDACYGGPQGRTGAAIIHDLLFAARAWLTQTTTGAWGLIQDSPRASTLEFDTAADLITIDEYGDGDRKKTVTLEYRPKSSVREEFSGRLSRETAGATGELKVASPYVRDHTTADKIVSYLQKLQSTLSIARGAIHAVHLTGAERITITDALNWTGAKSFIPPVISRPADSNRVTLREYDADIYTYTPGDLPAGATNVYGPDYSYTPPAAPTALTNVSSGQSADGDGKVTAYIKLRVTPPAVNWAQLWALVVDTTTNEEYFGQFQLVGGNYDVVVGGLRPNRAHNAYAWAVNGNNVKGTLTGALAFTSANATTALGAPTVTVTQVQSKEVKVELAAVADVAGQPKLRRYILFEKVGAGAYTEVKRSEERMFIRTVVHGTTYYYKARTEDQIGNESADSAETNITPAKTVNGDYIVDGSINRGRSSTSTGSSSGTNSFGAANLQINMELYTFTPSVYTNPGGLHLVAGYTSLGNDQGTVTIAFTANGQTWDVRWRYFVP